MVTRICDVCGKPIGDRPYTGVVIGDQVYDEVCPDCIDRLKKCARKCLRGPEPVFVPPAPSIGPRPWWPPDTITVTYL